MKTIKQYFKQYSKSDWEIVGYLGIILLMLLVIPVFYLWDYTQSYDFQLQWVRWKFFLTESLRNLHVFEIDIFIWAWYTSYIS